MAAGIALVLALVATLGTAQVLDARSTNRTLILSGEQNAAHLASAALASALSSRLDLVSNLAGQPQLAPYFSGADEAKLSQLTSVLHLLYPGFASFFALSASGRVLARWPSDPSLIGQDIASSNLFRGVTRTGKPYLSVAQQQTAPPEEFVVDLAAPVMGSAPVAGAGAGTGPTGTTTPTATPTAGSTPGKTLGFLGATLSLKTLGTLVGGTSLLSGGEMLIFDQAGDLVTGPAAGAGHSYAHDAFVSQALRGTSGSGEGDVPSLTGERLVGYAAVPSTGWAVVVEHPVAELQNPVDALTERLIAIGLIVLALAVGTAVVVGRLVRQLGREHERAGAVWTSVGEGVALIGPDGRVLGMNPALATLTGRDGTAMTGRHCTEVIPLYDAHGRALEWGEGMISKAAGERRVVASSGYDLYLGAAGGRRIPIAVTAAPLLVGDELEGSVAVIRDISHEREVDQLKSSLVSTVSHELRTPLTMIQGFSELLLADGLDHAQSNESIAQIHSSARRLGRLIDDLLSVSRIESGRLNVDLAPVEIGDVASEVRASFANQGLARLTVTVDPALGPLLADRDKVVQIVTNLVSNALKYSGPQAPVRLLARLVGDHAEISVIDEGIGMSEAEAERVFEKFVRADNAHVRRVSGSGLGLYIARSLVELHHGQLWVRSEVGSGSTFTFSLPLAEGDEALAASPPTGAGIVS